MMKPKYLSWMLITIGWLLVLGVSPLAGQTCCPQVTPSAGPSNEVIQEFPPGGPMETAWRVRYGHATGKGLFITGAWFKRLPSAPWMRILWDARLSDIFVPYHSGYPRYLDLTGFNFQLVPVSSVDLGCCGTKLDNYVIREVRDRGMLWKDDTQGRRGYELVLWATLDAANYNYIIQYAFRDDGTIAFRVAGTARNLPGSEMEAHMHNGLWRVDIDLNGFTRDSALLARHDEQLSLSWPWTITIPTLGANDTAVPFNGGREGGAVWNSLEFTEVRVVDTGTNNAQGKPIGYDLRPLRRGRSLHVETYTRYDFWVTRYRYNETFYTQLPSYVSNKEPITNTDVVLWHISPIHHLPRSEDGTFVGNLWKGVALVMWGGFDLRPRNLFDRTPFFPY